MIYIISARVNIIWSVWNYWEWSPVLGLILLPWGLMIRVGSSTWSYVIVICRDISRIFFIGFIWTVSRQKKLRLYHAFSTTTFSLLLLKCINYIYFLSHKLSFLLFSLSYYSSTTFLSICIIIREWLRQPTGIEGIWEYLLLLLLFQKCFLSLQVQFHF